MFLRFGNHEVNLESRMVKLSSVNAFSRCLQWSGEMVFFWVTFFTFANSGVASKIGLLSRESASVYFKGLIRHISVKPPLVVFTVWNLGVWGSSATSAISSDPSLLLLFLAIVLLKEKKKANCFPWCSLYFFFSAEVCGLFKSYSLIPFFFFLQKSILIICGSFFVHISQQISTEILPF